MINIDFSNSEQIKSFFAEDTIIQEDKNNVSLEIKKELSVMQSTSQSIIPTRDKMMQNTAMVIDRKILGAIETQDLLTTAKNLLMNRLVEESEKLSATFLLEAVKTLEASGNESITTLKTFLSPSSTKDGANSDSTLNIIFSQDSGIKPKPFGGNVALPEDTKNYKFLSEIHKAVEIVMDDINE